MVILYIILNILANALSSLQISPLLLIRIATIVLLYAAALYGIYLSVVYIQSIGSGIVVFSGLFTDFPLEIVPNQLLASSLSLIKPRLTRVEKEAFSLSKELEDILIGHLLGDGCMRKFNLDPNSKSNARLLISQSEKQSDLVNHLYELLKEYVFSAPVKKSSLIKETGNTRHYVRFATRNLPCFNNLYSQFYANRVKIVPLNIADSLTAVGLAYWLMGDGTWVGSGVRIQTEYFTLKEVILLIDVLNFKFGLNSSVNVANKSKGQYSIYVPKKDLELLKKLVTPYFLPTFLYKLGISEKKD
jgi:hypothetical protein